MVILMVIQPSKWICDDLVIKHCDLKGFNGDWKRVHICFGVPFPMACVCTCSILFWRSWVIPPDSARGWHGCLSVQVRWNVWIQCPRRHEPQCLKKCDALDMVFIGIGKCMCFFVLTKMISLRSIWSITCFYSISIQLLVGGLEH
jgi:hypothetical protein